VRAGLFPEDWGGDIEATGDFGDGDRGAAQPSVSRS